MRALSALDGFVRFDLEGADHPFTPVMVQQQVSDLLTDRLTSRFAGPPRSEGRVKAFRFSDEELALLEQIQGHTGIKFTHRGASNRPRVLREGRGHLAGQTEMTAT